MKVELNILMILLVKIAQKEKNYLFTGRRSKYGIIINGYRVLTMEDKSVLKQRNTNHLLIVNLADAVLKIKATIY